jgi:hypothetical protein
VSTCAFSRMPDWWWSKQVGRHRDYRLASPGIAAWLEKIDALDLSHEVGHVAPTARRQDTALALARSCYDHLAGSVGVQLHDAFVDRGFIEITGVGGAVTAVGRDQLVGLGIDIGAAETSRRATVRTCLDWTERRHHIAGGLGAAVLTTFLDQRWFSRKPSGRRLLVPTTFGRDNLANHFGIR